MLQPIMIDLDNLIEYSVNIDRVTVTETLDQIYNNVVNALCLSANLFIPKHKKNFYKFWWTQELDVLKLSAIASCRAWKNAGSPKYGPIFSEYKKCKLLYKTRLREERTAETCNFTNDLHDALLRKSGQEFWRTWKSKFSSNSSSVVKVDGSADNQVIADKFANYFESISRPFSTKRDEELKTQYTAMRSMYYGSPITPNQQFDVELMSKLVATMPNGKAAGLDGLVCEHIKFSHPIVICLLTKFFNLLLSLGHIPVSFGVSYTVPVPKCDGRTRALSTEDFRGISISPVISKLFEMAIMDKFSNYFVTSDHQFGFKKNIGCREAIYSMRHVIETFIANGSTVSVCALDLSKAFDRMNHYALLLKLMKRDFPLQLLSILETWFAVAITCVKWNEYCSSFFRLSVGVRQGGVLSPYLFAIFIDDLIDRVKSSNTGCFLSFICCCVFLYADDILLLSPSITGLQALLTVCERELDDLDMRINVTKSSCVRFGSRYNEPCVELVSNHGGVIHWANSCRYLGVELVGGRSLRCSFDNLKSRFFRAFNAIYGKVGRFASDPVLLSLIRTKCMPVLLYAVEACPLLSRQMHSLEFSLTRIFMRIFHTSSTLTVKQCQVNFNFLPIAEQIELRTARFLQKFLASQNILCSLFARNAAVQLNVIFSKYDSVHTIPQLRVAIYSKFNDCI